MIENNLSLTFPGVNACVNLVVVLAFSLLLFAFVLQF